MRTILFRAACVLVCAASAGPAMAEKSVTGSATLVSDYRFRGISLSDEDPAVQGAITLSHDSGFYVGGWASSLQNSAVFGDTEVDLYGGWAGEIGSGTTLDVGLTYYVYPDGESAFGNSDYAEPYVKLGHTSGPVKATIGAAYAWGQSAIADADNLYLFTEVAAVLPGMPVTLKAHAGYSDGSLAPTGDYFDWSLGADAAFGPVTVGVAYVDTDFGNVPNGDAGVVLSIGITL